MKYTSPIYDIEAIKTNDVVLASPYTVAHVNKVTGTTTNENGETVDTVELSTLVTVNIGGLF